MNDTIPAPPPQTLTPGQETRTVLAETRRAKAELLTAIGKCVEMYEEEPNPHGKVLDFDCMCASRIERMYDLLWVVYQKHGPYF